MDASCRLASEKPKLYPARFQGKPVNSVPRASSTPVHIRLKAMMLERPRPLNHDCSQQATPLYRAITPIRPNKVKGISQANFSTSVRSAMQNQYSPVMKNPHPHHQPSQNMR